MPVITFAHHKGGTGKTTSCLNIAGVLQKQGRSVLVVDCDPQANATSGLGVSTASIPKGMYDVFMGQLEGTGVPGIREVITTTESRIDLAPATLDLVGVEPALYAAPHRAMVLKQILAPIRENYPFILVDTPPSIGQLVINGLAAADHTIVTLDAGVFAVKGVGTLSTIFQDMASLLGTPVRQEMAILTRWEGGTATPDLLAQLAAILERLVDPHAARQKEAERARLEETQRDLEKQFARVFTVPLSMEIPQAQARGLPLSHVAPESPAGIAYRQIAEEVVRWS